MLKYLLVLGLFLSTPLLLAQDDFVTRSNYLLYQGNNAADLALIQAQEKKTRTPAEAAQVQFRYFAHYSLTKNDKLVKKVLAALEKLAPQNNIAKSYYHLAHSIYLFNLSIADKALEEALRAETIAASPTVHDNYLRVKIYYLIYGLHSRTEDAEKCRRAIQKGIQAANRAKYAEGLANFYNAKASIFHFGHGVSQKRPPADSAYFYLQKSLSLAKKHPKEITSATQLITHLNLSDYFNRRYGVSKASSDLDSCKNHLLVAENIQPLPPQFVDLRAVARGQRALLFLDEENTAAAEKLMLLNEKELLQYSPNSTYTLMQNAEALKNLYRKQQQPDKALYYAEQQLKYSQQEYDQTLAATNKTLETKFELRTMQNRLQLAEEEKILKRTQVYLLLTLTIIISLLLYHSKSSSRQKIKLHETEAERLRAETSAAQLTLELEKENRERLAAEKEILRLENEKTQRENLLQSLRLEQKQKTLHEIEEQIQQPAPTENLQKLLKREHTIDKSLDMEDTHLENLRADFYEKLSQVCPQLLTARDQKICAYVYVGLSNKEIASILNVEPKSVRMSKYRIKQKMQLDKETDLRNYLESLWSLESPPLTTNA